MGFKSYYLLLFFLLLGAANSFASHIVGGYIRYDCLGNANASTVDYRVEVVLYRDVLRANPGAVFTNTLPITIFSNGTNRVATIVLQNTKFVADSIEDPCFVRIDSLELEEGFYSGVVQLERDRTHLLVYQRCCRNNSIDNLIKPTNDWGSTWTIEVPEFDQTGCNSSPAYSTNPPVAFCPSQPLNLDLSATDADGDSLVYSFCAPYTSPRFDPEPIPAIDPPYATVNFLLPQTATFPVPSNPALTVNSQSGFLTGSPTSIGQYVLGFCIEEYRQGVLLSTSRRDIQINTANCNPVILTAVQDQTLLCDGRTVDFQNNTPSVPGYNIKGFFWDFGDPTTLADTSRDDDPTYTYADTGTYTITLIANPGLRCSDTATTQFRVYESLDPQIEVSGLFCQDSNSLDFNVGGNFEDYASFNWFFGPAATPLNSNQDTVRNVSFTASQSNFTVSLQVDQDVCREVRSRVIELFPNPLANFTSDLNQICPPFPVAFANSSTVAGSADFLWTFGDGDSSNLSDPSHTYEGSGSYEVVLNVIATDRCIDTVAFRDSIFASSSFSTNQIGFDFTPKQGCPPLEVNFFDTSQFAGSADYFWDFDNNQLSNQVQPSFTYTDSGYYDIGLLLITSDSCRDTLNLRIDSAIRIFPSPEADLQISRDSSSIKGAEIELDARNSIDYRKGSLFFEDRLISQSDLSLFEPTDTGSFVFSWVAENQFECLDTATADLFVFDEYEFEIPNIFTPNGDGINDEFKVRACGVYDYFVQIFNRYGEEVYASRSLGQGWDGRINGKKAHSGVYFYRIVIRDLNNQVRDFQGTVTLLED